jgi:hypothetical protein
LGICEASSESLKGSTKPGQLHIDMFDILTFVTAVAEGREATDYMKVATRLTRKVILDEP